MDPVNIPICREDWIGRLVGKYIWIPPDWIKNRIVLEKHKNRKEKRVMYLNYSKEKSKNSFNFLSYLYLSHLS